MNFIFILRVALISFMAENVSIVDNLNLSLVSLRDINTKNDLCFW